MQKIERVFYHCDLLEEAPMWCFIGKERGTRLTLAAKELMQDCRAFEAAMVKALGLWPYSCAQNLSALNTNRLAWLGHAGCYVATGSPEANTRKGWQMLSEAEQDAANAAAQKVIDLWESQWITTPH